MTDRLLCCKNGGASRLNNFSFAKFGVYADQLRLIFESVTGLHCKTGVTMRNSYTVVIHGIQLMPRTSEREYSHCIVAEAPKAPPPYADLGASWMTAEHQR